MGRARAKSEDSYDPNNIKDELGSETGTVEKRTCSRCSKSRPIDDFTRNQKVFKGCNACSERTRKLVKEREQRKEESDDDEEDEEETSRAPSPDTMSHPSKKPQGAQDSARGPKRPAPKESEQNPKVPKISREGTDFVLDYVWSMDKKLERLQKENDQNEERQADLESKCQGLETNLENETRRRERAEKRLGKCRDELHNARLSIGKSSPEIWFPKEDAAISDKVSQLYKDIRKWSKNYVAESLANLPKSQNEDWLCWIQNRSNVFWSSDGESEEKAVARILDFEHPFVFLCAEVANLLHDNFFQHPFTFLNWIKKQMKPGDAEAAARIFLDMRRVNREQANIWRSQMARNLLPQLNAASPASADRNAAISVAAEAHGRKIMNQFLTGPSKCLLRAIPEDEVDKRNAALHSICCRAATVWAVLQTELCSFRFIKPSDYLGKQYAAISSVVQPDALHKLGSDEVPRSYGSKVVQVALTPCLGASGNANGENFHETRILLKACAWMEDGVFPKIVDSEGSGDTSMVEVATHEFLNH